MRKTTKLYILLGILIVVCAVAIVISRYEAKQEEIRNSGEVILEIETDSITALSWTNESGTYSFTKDENWTYDSDTAFPVDTDKITDLVSQFESLTAEFVIENVEDYSQYGLEEPLCTINITAGETSYTITLGDFSTMDEQRYISLGDGKAYLVEHDPLDEFDAVADDLILNDTIPEFDTATQITFTGIEDYTIVYDEDAKSICADDVYFTDGNPLDTDNVDDYIDAITSLDLTSFVSYNVTDEELETFGMNEPDLTVALEYTVNGEDGTVESGGTLNLTVSRNPEEVDAYIEAVNNDEDELPSITCYVRIGDSQIIYEITQSEYDDITAMAYTTLRHQEIFTADFSTVTSVDVTLSGETYTLTYTPPEDEDDEDAEGTWTYNDETFDISDFEDALEALTASSFTSEEPEGEEEISLTVHLDNEDFQTFDLTIYRYDGTNCIACVDGTPVAYIARSEAVDLIEAVNELIL